MSRGMREVSTRLGCVRSMESESVYRSNLSFLGDVNACLIYELFLGSPTFNLFSPYISMHHIPWI